jgi:hypothetical protein
MIHICHDNIRLQHNLTPLSCVVVIRYCPPPPPSQYNTGGVQHFQHQLIH